MHFKTFPKFQISFYILLSISWATSRPYVVQPTKTVSEDFNNEYISSLNDVDIIPDPEVLPGLFEGDIAGMTPEMLVRIGVNWKLFPERKWTNATVPYIISSKYLPYERLLIETGIAMLNFFTCINFIPWDGKKKDYLFILPHESLPGCWSSVGKDGGQQMIGLQRSTDFSGGCLKTFGKTIHELLHALGTLHEHTRADRDNYVTVIVENIRPSAITYFAKVNANITTYDFPYDYNSIMHYGSDFFRNKEGYPTIISKKTGVQIGQRVMLSKGDCIKINSLYGCFDKEPFQSNKYEEFCNVLAF